jgi:ribulose-phosphate 3-epimerase
MKKTVKKSDLHISPSILAADFGNLNADMETIAPLVDSWHVDIMDGHFVPNLSFGPPVAKCIKTPLPLEFHLMVDNPNQYYWSAKDAGASMLFVHAEMLFDSLGTFDVIRGLGMKAGIAINPDTPLGDIEFMLPFADEILFMCVYPGFGGQSFMPGVLPKIKACRKLYPDAVISVDGGINASTGVYARAAGANKLISGTYIFGAKDRKAAIDLMRL